MPNKIGKCVYCGSLVYSPENPTRRLGDEHIIPEGLGGKDTLQEASCQKCEAATCTFEGACLRTIFGPTRIHLNLPSKRPKDRPTTLPVFAYFDGETTPRKIEVPVEKHPANIALLKMDTPYILGGTKGKGEREVIVCYPLTLKECNIRLEKLAQELKAKKVEIECRIGVDQIRLMFAKIAHCYSVLLYGVDGFVPFLNNFIRESDASKLKEYVGCGRPTVTKTEELNSLSHEIVAKDGKNLIVVRVGLLSKYTLPEYIVVSGFIP